MNPSEGQRDFEEWRWKSLYPEAEEVDIRGWIVDDNAGNFNSGGCTTGVGINNGHLRFAHVSAWESVPVGTVIVLYNGADNCYGFTADESGSGAYFINVNSTSLIERTGSGGTPSSSDCDYCGNSYTTATWDPISLGNTADAIQVRCPDCPESEAGFFHGVGYGSGFGGITAGTNDVGGVYYSGTGTGRTYELTGTGCGTLGDAGGWTRTTAPAAGTPPATVGVVGAGVLAWLDGCSVPCCGSFEPPVVVQKHGYRFGFQGQEKDNEIYGSEGTSYTAEFWQYDPRIGRRWNEDPVIRANWSGYVSLADNPIMVTDKNGDDWYVVTTSGMYIEKIEDKSHPDGIAVRQADGSFSYHVFNDQEHDVNNMESNLHFQQLFYGRTDVEPVVHILTEKDMLEIARDMSGGRKMWVGRHVKAFIHSQGGDMDGIQHLFRRYQVNTMHDLHRNEMGGEHNDSQFYLNTDGGRAYNYHDYGNYLWGAAMYDIGFDGEGDLNYILKAANDHSEASGAGPDTHGDQQAISSGYAARKFSKVEF